MRWKICVLFFAVVVTGCDIFDSCGPFAPLNKKSFQDSVTVNVPFDTIKLTLWVDYAYEGEIPITFVRTTEVGDSLKFVGTFDGEFVGDSVFKSNFSTDVEWRTDTLVLQFFYSSMSNAPNGDTPSKAKGSSQAPQCTPAGDYTKLTSGTLFLPPDLGVSIIWPRNVKVIE